MKKILSSLVALTISTTMGNTINNSFTTNNIKQQNNSDIVTNYDYYYGKTGYASWSGSLNFNNEETHSIINFTNYASDWNTFIKKYPYILINTYGEENSPETFGNVGKNKFGVIKINLNDINKNKTYWKNLVEASSNWLPAYNVYCNIRLGLWVKAEKELELNISFQSHLYSAGYYTRYLTTILQVNYSKLVYDDPY